MQIVLVINFVIIFRVGEGGTQGAQFFEGNRYMDYMLAQRVPLTTGAVVVATRSLRLPVQSRATGYTSYERCKLQVISQFPEISLGCIANREGARISHTSSRDTHHGTYSWRPNDTLQQKRTPREDLDSKHSTVLLVKHASIRGSVRYHAS